MAYRRGMSPPRNVLNCFLRTVLLFGPVAAAVVAFAYLLHSQDTPATKQIDRVITASTWR